MACGHALSQEIFNSQGMSMRVTDTMTLRRYIWLGTIPYHGGWYKWNLLKKHEPDASTTFGVFSIVSEALYTWTSLSRNQ
jgi:hypothetical protein